VDQETHVTTLNHLFFHHVDHYRHDRLLAWRSTDGMVVYSSERFVHSVLALRAFLRSAGLAEEGERVAIYAENRPEWHIADFAVLLARHIVVPVYPTLAPGQVQYLLEQGECRVAVISGRKQWEALVPMLRSLPRLEWIISMDEWDGPDAPPGVKHASMPAIAAAAPAVDRASLDRIRAECLSVDPATVATIVYTSGTTALPKGVMLSHANLIFDLHQCLRRIEFRTATRALSVLPLPHVFERLLSYGYFHMGVPVAYGDPHQLRGLLAEHHPEVMGTVPRILEKMREAIEAGIAALAPWKQRAARYLLRAGLERTRTAGGAMPLLAALAHRLLVARIRRQLGGLRFFICGGAWLDPELELFFRSLGFVVLQGYGLTETSPVIALSELGKEKPGSVGRALEGVELQISPEGEILTRGPHVMLGYYNDPEATRQALDDGWLRTGDLGTTDEQGYLRITGRRKDMLVLSNGKNVFCAALEQALARSPFIQHAFVVGEGRNFVCAVLIPHLENLAQESRKRGIPFRSYDDLLLSPQVVSLFRQEIDTRQAEFSNYERVKRFCFLGAEALQDPELVTPTQKMRRQALERKYAGWIAGMYRQEDPLLIPGGGAQQEVHAVHT
jgi:long-chain acyl-CoA synthetase